MTGGALTPIDVTFQSFKHSQGLISAQIEILKYVEGATGIAPSFDTSDEVVTKYLQLLGAEAASAPSQSKSHVDFKEDKTADFVRGAIELVATKYSEKAEMPGSLLWLVHGLVHSEVTKFQRIHWLNYFPDPERARKDKELSIRLQQRLAAGKLSFLYFYGRDGNTTNFPIFNQMYRDVWSLLSSDDTSMVRELEELELRYGQAEGRLEDMAKEVTVTKPS